MWGQLGWGRGGARVGSLCQACKSFWRMCAQLCAGTTGKSESLECLAETVGRSGDSGLIYSISREKELFPHTQCLSPISIVSLTSCFSPCSTTLYLAESQTSEGRGGGITHARGDASISTSAPISFSSMGRPLLVSGNYPPSPQGLPPRGPEGGRLLPG